MNKKTLGIVLAVIAVIVGILFIVIGINQMKEAGKAQQTSLSKEEIQKTLTASQGETAVYENPAVGIRLSHPKSWEKEEGQNSAVVFKIFAGAINVRFISDDLTSKEEPVTLQEYTQELMSQSIALGEKQNVAIKAVSDSDTTLAGLPAHQWLYTVTLDAIKGSGMQVWTVKNNRSYVLTFTAPESLFDTFLPVFKKLLETVAITK
ncbi:MAG: PsbP-related protein [Candidatus Uhrbacteria bacterium]|nr:PsbP-related protein [Candidatus Uhrbacteria bacterium]